MDVHGLVNIAQFFRSTAAVASGRTADSLALDTKHPPPREDGQVSLGQSRKNTNIHVDWSLVSGCDWLASDRFPLWFRGVCFPTLSQS